MPTGQVIVNNALTALGILEQGGIPSNSDSVDALGELNAMWDAWGIDEGLIYAVSSEQFSLVSDTASYTIGTGGTFDVPRPSRLYRAYLVATVGSAKTRRPLNIVPAEVYYAHGDLAAIASTADELYYDYDPDPTTGFANIYLFPAPSCPTASFLELEFGANFVAWALAVNYAVPQGFQDAIQYALAWRLIPRFGAAVAQQTVELIEQLGEKSEARILKMNAMNRQKPMPQAEAETPARAPRAA
jgi:hypothetical protein